MPNRDQIQDARALLPEGPSGTSRRTVLQAAIASGLFAAAVQPVSAQTMIVTSSDGLEAGDVRIDVNGFAMPAYRAAPQGRQNLPVVLVLSEIFGVHAHIADVARRLAHQGYLAIAPQLFVRQGDAASYTDIPTLMREVIAKVPDAQVLADLDATVRWAGQQGGDTSRLGVTGFCWGGRMTWLYAAHNPQVKAGVAWYGRLAGTASALTPSHPLDLVDRISAPVLGLYGAKDQGIPVSDVEDMRADLAKAGKKAEFVIYPEAGHAFHADYRPSYRAAEAAAGWARLLAWFERWAVGNG